MNFSHFILYGSLSHAELLDLKEHQLNSFLNILQRYDLDKISSWICIDAYIKIYYKSGYTKTKMTYNNINGSKKIYVYDM